MQEVRRWREIEAQHVVGRIRHQRHGAFGVSKALAVGLEVDGAIDVDVAAAQLLDILLDLVETGLRRVSCSGAMHESVPTTTPGSVRELASSPAAPIFARPKSSTFTTGRLARSTRSRSPA
jgi:hypothetical protein